MGGLGRQTARRSTGAIVALTDTGHIELEEFRTKSSARLPTCREDALAASHRFARSVTTRQGFPAVKGRLTGRMIDPASERLD